MGKIYKNQTALRISLDTNITLAAGDSAIIKYKKPDGNTGSWSAIIDTPNVYYDIVSSSDLDQDGTWIFWSYVTFSGGGVAPGEPASVKVCLIPIPTGVPTPAITTSAPPSLLYFQA